MPANSVVGDPQNYASRFVKLAWLSLAQLVRSPSHSRRAEAIGLRYNVAKRIEGYNISQGKAISVAIFRSEGTE